MYRDDFYCPHGGAEPQGLLLPQDSIDLWVVPVAQVSETELAHQFDTVLSEQERQQQVKFMFAKDRRRYLVTRALVRQTLSRYLPVRPADWRFAATAFGRPFIVNQHPDVAGLNFNISHSDQCVVLGLARGRELGVDVEDLHRSVPLEIADHFFAPDEVRQLHALPPQARPQRFLEFWTLKESYIKARGKGLSLPLEQFGFGLDGPGPLKFFFNAAIDDRPGRWTFWQWLPSADSIAALCAENRPNVEFAIRARRVTSFSSSDSMLFNVTRTSASNDSEMVDACFAGLLR